MQGPHGHRDRLKARFFSEGLDGFHPHEALELLLFYALPRRDTKPIARALLRTFGSLYRVLEASPQELARVEGIGEHAAGLLCMQTQLFRYYMADRWGEKPDLSSRSGAGQYCASLFIGKHYEELKIIALNNAYRLLHQETLFLGTIDEVPIYGRQVVEYALRHQAASILLAHNHPGGTASPSSADIQVTQVLREALRAVDVRLLDHIVVTGESYVSVSDLQGRRKLMRGYEEEDRAAEPK